MTFEAPTKVKQQTGKPAETYGTSAKLPRPHFKYPTKSMQRNHSNVFLYFD